MHDRFRILTVKRPLPERSEAKEIFLVPTDAAQNPIIGPDLSEPSAYLPSREALQAHPSPNVCKNEFSRHLPQPCLGSLADHISLKLGHCPDTMKHQFACRGRGVDILLETSEFNSPLSQQGHRFDQLLE